MEDKNKDSFLLNLPSILQSPSFKPIFSPSYPLAYSQ